MLIIPTDYTTRTSRMGGNDTLKTLKIKIHSIKHQIPAKAIQLFAQEKLQIIGKKVNILQIQTEKIMFHMKHNLFCWAIKGHIIRQKEAEWGRKRGSMA